MKRKGDIMSYFVPQPQNISSHDSGLDDPDGTQTGNEERQLEVERDPEELDQEVSNESDGTEQEERTDESQAEEQMQTERQAEHSASSSTCTGPSDISKCRQEAPAQPKLKNISKDLDG